MTQCYYPDGTDSSDVPCNSTASESACCGAGAYCLGNGMCWNGDAISRGSCTTTDWTNSACVQECQDANPTAGCAIQLCEESDNAYYYGCQVGLDNCEAASSSSSLFTLGVAASTVVLQATQLASALSAAGSTSAASAIDATATSGTTGTSGTTVATATASTSGASSTSHCPTIAPSGGMYTSGDMAGVGVGIGLPLALALAAAIALFRREKKRTRAPMATGLMAENSHDHAPASAYSHPIELPNTGVNELGGTERK